jgi:hypothetical protein
VAWEGVGEDTKKSYSARLRKISHVALRIKRLAYICYSYISAVLGSTEKICSQIKEDILYYKNHWTIGQTAINFDSSIVEKCSEIYSFGISHRLSLCMT